MTAKKAATTASAPRKVKTSAELKQELAKAKTSLAALENRIYAGELSELIAKTNIVSSFNSIKANISGATDIVILAAIGKAVGIPRLVITQSEASKRKAKAK